MADLANEENESNKKSLPKIKNEIHILRKSEKYSFKIFDFAMVILSFFSVLSDFCTDIILVIQYIYQGYKTLALATFILIFVSSLITQFFSIKWHVADKSLTTLRWIYHILMLGIVHRYILVIKSGYNAYKSKNIFDIEKVYLDQSDLCILHVFESFLESSPQLVLQMYVILALNEWTCFTVLSAIMSLMSLSWALAAYSKIQRQARPNKKCSSCIGLILQAFWNGGMLLARITTLVLGAYCFGNYMFLLIAIHWLTMTIWVISQKTDFCDSYWDEKLYNAVVGVIYCFCFFNLKEGQSRWKMIAFHLIIIFQNLSCLTIFLMWFGNKFSKLPVASFVAVVGGTCTGIICMLVYYRFYHPSGPIKFFIKPQKSPNIQQHQFVIHSSPILRSLKQVCNNIGCDLVPKHNARSDYKNAPPASDSIVVIEDSDDEDADIKTLREWISKNEQGSESLSCKKIFDSEHNDNSIKRRAICSTPHLVKLLEIEAYTEGDKNLELNNMDDTVSEIVSAHDYENLCPVNIAREIRGIRSWKAYSDIETWLHDDSVVNDRGLDTMTSTATSSERSCSTYEKVIQKVKQDDHTELPVYEFHQNESEINFENIYLIENLPISYPLGTLNTIYEEVEEKLSNTISTIELSTEKAKHKILNSEGASSLVATIEEITHKTPISSRFDRASKKS